MAHRTLPRLLGNTALAVALAWAPASPAQTCPPSRSAVGPELTTGSSWSTGFFFPEDSPQYYVAIGTAGAGDVSLYQGPDEVQNGVQYCCSGGQCRNCCTGNNCINVCTSANCDRETTSDVLIAVWRTGGSTSASSVFCDRNNLVAQRRIGSLNGQDQIVSFLERSPLRLDINIDTEQGFVIDNQGVCSANRGQTWLTFDLSTNNRLRVRAVAEGGCGESNETAFVDFSARGDDVIASAGRTNFGFGLPTVFDNDGDPIVGFASGNPAHDVEHLFDGSAGDPYTLICPDGASRTRGRRGNRVLCPASGDAPIVDSSFVVARERDSGDLRWARLLATRTSNPLVQIGNSPAGLVVDAADNIVVLGTVKQNIDFGEGPLELEGPLGPNGEQQPFLYFVKYSPEGDVSFARVFNASGAGLITAGWGCGASSDSGPCRGLVHPALSVDPSDGTIVLRGETSDGLEVDGNFYDKGRFEVRMPDQSPVVCSSSHPCLAAGTLSAGGCYTVPLDGFQCSLPDGATGICSQGACGN